MVLNQSNYGWVALGVAVTVLLLQWWYAYHSRLSLKDQPDQRSLHQSRAITGAGILMFLPFCLVGLVFFPLFVPLYVILLFSLLGFVDDKMELSFQLRLLVQISLSIITLYAIGIREPIVLMVFLTVALIWWINLFNFMDGANGMAGLHGLLSIGFYGWIFADRFSQTNVFTYMFVAGVLVLLVYLLFNLILKRLFMGDSGSLPLAWLVAVLALYALHYDLLNMLQIAIIHAAFIVDATLTLIYRLKNQENITQAHATHLYQRWVKAGRSHATVSLCYAGVTGICCLLVWLTRGYETSIHMGLFAAIYGILTLTFMKFLNYGR